MNIEANSGTPPLPPRFVSLRFDWEREGVASLVAFRADKTCVSLLAVTEENKAILVDFAARIEMEINQLRRQLQEERHTS